MMVTEPHAVSTALCGRPFVLAVCGAWPPNLRLFIEVSTSPGPHSEDAFLRCLAFARVGNVQLSTSCSRRCTT